MSRSTAFPQGKKNSKLYIPWLELVLIAVLFSYHYCPCKMLLHDALQTLVLVHSGKLRANPLPRKHVVMK